jgi:hypothetical protein
MKTSLEISGLEQAKKLFSKDYINRALSQALNNTAKDTREAEIKEMKRVFKNPIPYTLNAIYIWYSKPDKLEGGLRFREWPKSAYINPQVEGGTRHMKGSEKAFRQSGIAPPGKPYWVPGAVAPLDAYGNFRGGTMNQIISRLGANRDPLQNVTEKSRKRRRGKNAAEYALIRYNPKLLPGIYQRQGRKLRPVLIFINEPHYKAIFDFYGVAQRTVNERLQFHFNRALYERRPK